MTPSELPDEDDCSIAREAVAGLLTASNGAWLRAALERDENGYRASRLELTIDFDRSDFEPAVWDYGRFCYIAAPLTSDEARGLVMTGETRARAINGQIEIRVELPDTAYSQRQPSRAGYDRPALGWPYRRICFSSSGANRQTPSTPRFLVGPGSPSFPGLAYAETAFFHDERSLAASPSSGDLLVIRALDRTGRIDSLTLTPATMEVQVSSEPADDIASSALRVDLVSANGFAESPIKPGEITVLDLPSGDPAAEWWVVLSVDRRWLDFRAVPRFGAAQTDGVNTVRDQEDELQTILSRGETSSTEFKRDLPASRADADRRAAHRIMRTFAAFANGGGGVVLFGVEDDASIVGVSQSFEDFRDRLTHVINDVVVPRPTVVIRALQASPLVVAAVVERGEQVPYGVGPDNPQYYLRRNATTVPASPDEVRLLARSRPPIRDATAGSYLW